MAAFNFPASPSNGDNYTLNGVTYQYDGTKWVRFSSSVGAQGAAGSTGPSGPTGAQGAQGLQGAQAHISTSAPSSGVSNGDLWWDSDGGDLSIYYNDGSSAQWVDINTGPRGAQGGTGPTGAQGATGSGGSTGSQGATGPTGAQGATGSTGAQGAAGSNGGTDIVNDTSPQLGGHLDVNDFQIKNGNQIYEIVANARHRFYSAGNQIIDINGNGVDFLHGNNTHADNVKSQFGASNDLQIVHDAADSYITNTTGVFYIQNTGDLRIRVDNTDAAVHCVRNGAVELYHDNLKRFETSADGCIFSGPTNTTASVKIIGAEARSAEIRLIADDGDDYTDTVRLHQSINGRFYLQNLTASATFESMLVAVPNGAVELYHDNSKKLETTSSGVQILSAGTGRTLYIEQQQNADSEAIAIRQFGNQSQGATIMSFLNWAGSEYASIESESGGTAVNYTTKDDGKFISGASNDIQIFHSGGHNYIKGTQNQFIYIATNSTNRWSFSNDGHFRPEATNTYDIGSTAQRVRNIYVNDLQLSNKAKKDTGGNDVDGTWGDWTLQEGESDVYMINNRTGKKYAMMLREVE